MRTAIIGVVIAALVASGAGVVWAHEGHDDHAEHAREQQSAQHAPESEEDAESPQEAQPVYVCPMHPEVRQEKPGRCPKCGMDLVAEVAEPGDDEPQGEAAPSGASSTESTHTGASEHDHHQQ